MSLLTDKQQLELNKCILAYLETTGLDGDVVAKVKTHFVSLDPSFPTEARDASDTKKLSQILEKKWTSVVRLQRKILDMETQMSSMKLELENAQVNGGLKTTSNDPENWLPHQPAKYTLSGHRQPITSIAFHPFFSILSSASDDGSIKIWDWELGELERTLKGHTRSVLDLDFGGPSKSEILMASCSSDLTIKLWDPNSDYSNIRTLTGHDHTISSVRFTPEGTHLISGSRDKTIRIWEVKTGYAIRTIIGHSEWVKCVVPSFDSSYILSAGIDQSARISNIQTGEGKLLFVGHEHAIEDAVFAPRTANKYLSALEGLKKPIDSNYSASFDYIATASRDKTIKIWNTRQEVVATLVGHDNWVRGLVFHPGGRYLISVADDKSMRCWDLSQQGRCVKVIHDAHHHFVSCVKWAPSLQTVNNGGASEKDPDLAVVLKNMRSVIATASIDLDIKIWV